MHSSLLYWTLILLTSQETSAAPAKRQFGPNGQYGPRGPGRPGSGGRGSWPGWTPPWGGPASDNSQPDFQPAQNSDPPTTSSDTDLSASGTVESLTTDLPSTAASPVIDTTTLSIFSASSLSSATSIISQKTDSVEALQTVSSSGFQTVASIQTTDILANTPLTATNTPGVFIETQSSTAAQETTLTDDLATVFISGSILSSGTTETSSTQSTTLSAAQIGSSSITSVSPSTVASTVTSTSLTSTFSQSISISTQGTSTIISSSSATTSSTASQTTTVASTVTSVPNASATPGNLLNGTFPNNSPPTAPPQPTPGLNVELVNTFTDSDTVYVYITAMDPSGRVMFLTPSQTWFYPTSSSSTIPQSIDSSQITIKLGSAGSTTTLNLPGYFNSGRIYFSRGTSLAFFTILNDKSGVTIVQPNALNPTDSSYGADWSFVEMTYTSTSGLFANLSFVDFLSRLALGMQLTLSSGSTQTVQGTSTSSVDTLCSGLTAQAAKDGQPWDKLCQTGSNANNTTAVDTNAFHTYWDNYVTAVWAKYATEDLLIDTQTNEYSIVSCSTASGNLLCPGSSRPLPPPLSTSPLFAASNPALDIFACSGIFSSLPTDNALTLAILPRLCAALNRSTLLLDTTTPTSSIGPSRYYTDTETTNWYAKLVHEVEKDGKGYAFAYDDVAPTGSGDVSGTVAGSVDGGGSWKVWVGGQQS